MSHTNKIVMLFQGGWLCAKRNNLKSEGEIVEGWKEKNLKFPPPLPFKRDVECDF